MKPNPPLVLIDTPLVSIVIPTCDRRDILSRCLEALARQTYPNFEIIVVDDCSTDDTPELLRRMVDMPDGPPLRALRNDQPAGANPSRNRGIRAACGEFVAFLDSDCIAEPEWLAGLMRGFVSDRVAAVTGRVVDLPPSNIYELTFKGTHRLARPGPARRLVAGNMCVRRELLLRYRLDEDRAEPATDSDGRRDIAVSGRGDEEGLFLLLRAAGYEQHVVPDAVVLHEHRLAARTFFRQALRGGRSAARLVYKYYLPQRLDMLPFILTYLALPLVLAGGWWWLMPLLLACAAIAALVYNDLVNKGKTAGEMIRSFPILLIYYHVRLCGYVFETARLRLTSSGPQRVSLGRVAGDVSKVDAQ